MYILASVYIHDASVCSIGKYVANDDCGSMIVIAAAYAHRVVVRGVVLILIDNDATNARVP